MSYYKTITNPTHYPQNDLVFTVAEFASDGLHNRKHIMFLFNALKYLIRFNKRGRPKEDLYKARSYIDRIIQDLEERDIEEPQTGKL